MYMAAARISDRSAVIDTTLYWAAVADVDEARFLTAVLNSETLTRLVRPLQARGEHNPRHFDKYGRGHDPICIIPLTSVFPSWHFQVSQRGHPSRRRTCRVTCHGRHGRNTSSTSFCVSSDTSAAPGRNGPDPPREIVEIGPSTSLAPQRPAIWRASVACRTALRPPDGT
jgi:hypothetical protein